MTPVIWFLIAATVALIVAGQLLLKRGLHDIGSPSSLGDAPKFFIHAITNPTILLGIAAIGIGAPCWMVVISRADLSLAYPFMSLTIVLVIALSGLLFGEVTPINRWVGVGIVCVGLIVTTRA